MDIICVAGKRRSMNAARSLLPVKMHEVRKGLQRLENLLKKLMPSEVYTDVTATIS